MTTTTRSNLAAISERDRLVYAQQGFVPTPAVKDRHELLELLRECRSRVTAARADMDARAKDLSWCTKPDSCNVQARGAELALTDFDDAVGGLLAELAALDEGGTR